MSAGLRPGGMREKDRKDIIARRTRLLRYYTEEYGAATRD